MRSTSVKPEAIVRLRDRVTGGSGTTASPFTGWDTAGWNAYTTYVFDGLDAHGGSPAYFACASPITVGAGKSGARFKGSGMHSSVVRCTGNAEVFKISTELTDPSMPFAVGIEDLSIDGNQTCTVGILHRHSHHCLIRNVRAYNVTQKGIYTQWCVCPRIDRFVCSSNYNTSTETRPVNGIVLSDHIGSTTAGFVSNCIIEGMGGDGVILDSALGMTISGGTSESNGGTGVQINANSSRNIINTNCEGNNVTSGVVGGVNMQYVGIRVDGDDNTIDRCVVLGGLVISAKQNTVVGGAWGGNGIVLTSTSIKNRVYFATVTSDVGLDNVNIGVQNVTDVLPPLILSTGSSGLQGMTVRHLSGEAYVIFRSKSANSPPGDVYFGQVAAAGNYIGNAAVGDTFLRTPAGKAFRMADGGGNAAVTLDATGVGVLGYTVANLPVAPRGTIQYATNGRKVGEGAGAGTGTMVYSDGVAWRRVGDDTTVLA